MKMMNFEATCDKIFDLAKMHGYSCAFIAEFCQVSPQAVSKWKNHVNLPTIDNFVRLSDLYDISLDELVECDYDSEEAYGH